MIREITITSLSGRGTVHMASREYWGYWLGAVDWGQVSGDHNTYKYYNQVGESIVSTSVGTRPLSITGWVVDGGSGGLQERCDALNKFISPVEDYTMEYKGKKIQFRPDISIAYSPEYKKNNEKVRRFLIQGTCPFPLFTDSEDTLVTFDKTKKMFRFPTDFGYSKPVVFAEVGKAFNATVVNKGSFSSGLIARLRFSGTVQAPRVWNLTTNEFVGVNRTFHRGEQLEISTLPGSKHMTMWGEDGTAQNVMKYRDYQTTWIQVHPGSNVISVDCADIDQRPNMEISVYYTPLYLEVE